MKVVSECIVGILIILAGCGSDPPVVSHGTELISVDLSLERQVGIALDEVHREIGKWIINSDNTKSDPTYKAGSRTWSNGPDKNTKVDCFRSYMEFHTDKDIPVRIETVFIRNQSFLVLLNCDDAEETIRLHNVVMEKIRAQSKRKT
ncbi:MAG: hypothetical protein JW828_02670 [Sedimentisphaerales bacterium]|nr:hypothetical protein [Sedimentisphaerales bacterium]